MDKKELLLKRSVTTTTRDVELDDDLVVTVRGLRREEVRECQGKEVDNARTEKEAVEKANKKLIEIRMIARGLVDPVMTEEEVTVWLTDAPAGDSVRCMEAIHELSNMREGAGKSNLQKVRKRKSR